MNIRHILGISGGKDSAALAIYLKQKYPTLNIEYYNSDTGCELAETEKLIDDLVYLFRVCEKYSSISQKTNDLEKNDAYSFDMVTNRGINVRTQTYILPDKDKKRASELEKKINNILIGDNNIDVCTLLAILNKKMIK